MSASASQRRRRIRRRRRAARLNREISPDETHALIVALTNAIPPAQGV